MLAVFMYERTLLGVGDTIAVMSGVPNYLDIITDPMDLGTIKKNMGSHRYETHEQWAEDIRKVWANAMYFNAAGNHLIANLSFHARKNRASGG